MTQGLADLTAAVNNLSTAVTAAVGAIMAGGTSDAQLAPITAAIVQNTQALVAAVNPPPPPPPPAAAPAPAPTPGA